MSKIIDEAVKKRLDKIRGETIEADQEADISQNPRRLTIEVDSVYNGKQVIRRLRNARLI